MDLDENGYASIRFPRGVGIYEMVGLLESVNKTIGRGFVRFNFRYDGEIRGGERGEETVELRGRFKLRDTGGETMFSCVHVGDAHGIEGLAVYAGDAPVDKDNGGRRPYLWWIEEKLAPAVNAYFEKHPYER